MKILAAIVTYNREFLLSRCLDNLLDQTRLPDHVLVINNSSTDGTLKMLKQRGIDHITQDNVGSAGGWARSIQYALNEGFDAVWLMDDDGFPDKHALKKLVPKMSADIACVSCIVVRENDPKKFVFPFPVLSVKGLPKVFARKRKISTVHELRDMCPAGTYDFAHFFNGALINIRAVSDIGNVNTDYFIFGDEVDYFFRLRKYGAVLSVLDAIHYHPDVTSRPYSPQKVYYYTKNTLILHKKYFDKVVLRNVLAFVAVISRTARRNGLSTALRYLLGGDNQVFYRAIWSGLSGKLGKDYKTK